MSARQAVVTWARLRVTQQRHAIIIWARFVTPTPAIPPGEQVGGAVSAAATVGGSVSRQEILGVLAVISRPQIIGSPSIGSVLTIIPATWSSVPSIDATATVSGALVPVRLTGKPIIGQVNAPSTVSGSLRRIGTPRVGGLVVATGLVSGSIRTVGRRRISGGIVTARSTVGGSIRDIGGGGGPVPQPQPTIGEVAQRIYDALEPVAVADEALGWPLLTYVAALGNAFQDVADIVEDNVDGTPGWSEVVDIDRVPDAFIPWLGQFVGVGVDTNLDAASQKQQIRDHYAWQRGTPFWISNLVKPHLTGTRTVELIERSPTPYSFEILVYSTESLPDKRYSDIFTTEPDYDAFMSVWVTYHQFWMTLPSVLIDSALADNTPAGLRYNFTVIPGAPGTQLTYIALYIDQASYQSTYQAYQNYLGIYNNP